MENCRKRSNCQFNEIVCVKKYVNEYIQDDYNNLLKLKTQVEIHIEDEKNVLMIWNYFILACSFILSSLVAVSNIVEKIDFDKNIMHIVSMFYLDLLIFIAGLLLLIAVAHFVYAYYKKKSAARKEWVRYIKAVLQDIEEN